jgi:dihydrofolate reductase
MRAVTLYTLLSLDGVAEEPGNWLFDMDETARANLGRVIARQDDVLLGRGTYDYWAGYWPTSDVQPFADFVNGTPKHVFTSRPLEPEWAGTTVVRTPAAEYVRDLKAGYGGDIGVHGSIALARSLVAAGLVDELHLVVAPTLAGSGRRLFDGGHALRRAELLSAESTPAGLLLLDYRLRP